MAAALLLDADGHRVTVFERFLTPRPIGSGLMIQPTGLAVLDALGLGEAVRRVGAPVTRLFGRAGAGGPVVLDVRYAALGRGAGVGYGVHRAAVFDILHEAVRARAIQVETGREIAGAPPDRGGRRLRFADGTESGRFDLVVDALGCRSALTAEPGRELAFGALWASLDWPAAAGLDAAALEQRYRTAAVMVGVLPIGAAPGKSRPQAAFFWSLRTDRLQAWRDAGLDPWKAEVRALWPTTEPLLEQIRSPEQLTFARYAHRTLARPTSPGMVHIGDAWHSTSPQLGQGANMALLDAYALRLALRTSDRLDTATARYVRLRRRHVRLYQAMSAAFTPVYQSDSRVLPWLRDRVVGPLSRLWPATAIQAAMVSGAVGGPLGPLGLKRPRSGEDAD